ncbi:50S ribosomal protein L22 [bacterium]|nr:50S ribosomal protein L22 [bacterium]
MISKAIQRNIHISSRKAGLVCDLIRMKRVDYAIAQLENIDHKAAEITLKLLKSAIANATNNHRMNAAKLYILSIVANQGPTLKRVLPRAKGSANTIRKRSTHLEIILSDDEKDRLMQQESYKKHNKYNDLIHGKLDQNSRKNLHMTRKLQQLKQQETSQIKKDKSLLNDNSESAIYTKEEFNEVVIKDDDKKKSKKTAKKETSSTKTKLKSEDKQTQEAKEETTKKVKK